MRHIIYTLLVRRHYYKEKRYYVQNDRNLIEKIVVGLGKLGD